MRLSYLPLAVLVALLATQASAQDDGNDPELSFDGQDPQEPPSDFDPNEPDPDNLEDDEEQEEEFSGGEDFDDSLDNEILEGGPIVEGDTEGEQEAVDSPTVVTGVVPRFGHGPVIPKKPLFHPNYYKRYGSYGYGPKKQVKHFKKHYPKIYRNHFVPHWPRPRPLPHHRFPKKKHHFPAFVRRWVKRTRRFDSHCECICKDSFKFWKKKHHNRPHFPRFPKHHWPGRRPHFPHRPHFPKFPHFPKYKPKNPYYKY